MKDKKSKALLIKSYDSALYEKSPKEYYIKNVQLMYDMRCPCTPNRTKYIQFSSNSITGSIKQPQLNIVPGKPL